MKKYKRIILNTLLVIISFIFCILVAYTTPENKEGVKVIPYHLANNLGETKNEQ